MLGTLDDDDNVLHVCLRARVRPSTGVCLSAAVVTGARRAACPERKTATAAHRYPPDGRPTTFNIIVTAYIVTIYIYIYNDNNGAARSGGSAVDGRAGVGDPGPRPSVGSRVAAGRRKKKSARRGGRFDRVTTARRRRLPASHSLIRVSGAQHARGTHGAVGGRTVLPTNGDGDGPARALCPIPIVTIRFHFCGRYVIVV